LWGGYKEGGFDRGGGANGFWEQNSKKITGGACLFEKLVKRCGYHSYGEMQGEPED